MKENVIISLGGSTLFNNYKLNSEFLSSFSTLISKAHSTVNIGIVVGGGATAKTYVEAVKALGRGDFDADRVAIEATKLNALLLISLLHDKAYSKIPRDLDTGMQALQENLIPVCGGLLEGLTTDTVSALLAERSSALRLVNISNVDGIYDSDPRTNPQAKKYSRLTHDQLVNLCSKNDERKARTNFVFDVIASKIVQRSQIPLHFVSSSNLEQLEKAILGQDHSGTIVK